ncbi:MAG: DUF4403 family protein [Rhizomicrobium sp.]|jgi:hypothetical protein
MHVSSLARGATLVLVLALAACGFEAPAPKRTPPPPAPPTPTSTLAATLIIPAAAIVQDLNAKTKDEIARITDQEVDCAIAKCRLTLVATKTGPITGSAADGKLSLALPLTATADVSLKALFVKTKAHGVATGTVQTATSFRLAPDWRLDTNTTGRVDLSQADLKLGPLKMSVADIWNRNEQHISQPLFKALDKRVSAGIKIKPQAERLWAKAFHPIKVGKSPQSWLVLNPQRILIAQPATQNDSFVVSLGVEVQARVVVADQPPEEPLKTPPLPAPALLTTPSNRFSFVVPALLPYDEAASLALKRLDKKPIRLGSATVRFEKLEILPSGQDVVVAVRFCVAQNWDPFGWFDACGDGYLRGVPVFDAASGRIHVANIHYDVATESLVLNLLKAIESDELDKLVQNNLVFSVAKDLAKLDAELKTALAKPQKRGVSITGDIDSFGQPTLTWTKDGFLATFPAQGTISADLNLKD